MSKFTNRGVILPSHKEPAASRPIVDISELTKVYVPLLSEGKICEPTVNIYETVLRGNVLGTQMQDEKGSVIAPVTGVLSDLQKITHPLLGEITCAVLDCMVQSGSSKKAKSVTNLKSENIIDVARKAGIVDGLDGELLSKKLKVWQQSGCDLLVADGSEQEPYCSSAWSVLNESAEQVRDGLKLAARAVGTTNFNIAVHLSSKKYRTLIHRLEHKELFSVSEKYPANVVPSNSNARVIGVQACLALYRAAAFEEAQCDCVVTIAGDAVANPQNVRVPIGTLVKDVLHFCGLSSNPLYVILGDAMTGVTITDINMPIVQGITCILAITVRPQPKTQPCIGCGRCVQACHAGLLPFEIMRRLDNMHYERLSSLLPDKCDGCGACSHVCPSGLDVTAKVLEARDAQGTIFLKWGDEDDF